MQDVLGLIVARRVKKDKGKPRAIEMYETNGDDEIKTRLLPNLIT